MADAKAAEKNAALTSEAIELAEQERLAARILEPMPADCKRREHSGVTAEDNFNIIATKTDQALGRANSRITRCYNWFQNYQGGLKEELGKES